MQRALRKAIREYYAWNGDRNIAPVDFVTNKQPGKYQMVLVRFTDEGGMELSSLMTFQTWKDGHFDVTEYDVVPRQCEQKMVSAFENDPTYF